MDQRCRGRQRLRQVGAVGVGILLETRVVAAVDDDLTLVADLLEQLKVRRKET